MNTMQRRAQRWTFFLACVVLFVSGLHEARGQEFTINARVIDDLNGDGVVDAGDRLRTNCRLLVCPGDSVLTPDATGEFRLTVDPAVQQLPLRLSVIGCRGWLQRFPAGSVLIEQPADMQVDFLGTAAVESRAYSGFRHDFFDTQATVSTDSTLGFSLQHPQQSMAVYLDGTDWSAETWIRPEEHSTASVRIEQHGGTLCGDTEHFIAADITLTDSTEDIAVDFSAAGSDTYRLIAFLQGQEVHRIEKMRGQALSLPNTVRTWHVEGSAIVVRETCPQMMHFSDGFSVEADELLFEAEQELKPGFRAHSIYFSGEHAAAALYRESFRAFGLRVRGSDSAVLREGKEGESFRVSAPGRVRAGVELEVEKSAAGFEVEWKRFEDGIPPGDSARIELAYRGMDFRVIEHTVAELVVQASGATLRCIAPRDFYGDEPLSLVFTLDGEEVSRATIDGEVLAEFSEWPASSDFTTETEKPGVSLQWSEAITLQVPGHDAVQADKLRLEAPDFGARTKSVKKMKLVTQQYGEVDVEHGGPIISGLATITITGNVSGGSGAALPGQMVLVRRYESSYFFPAFSITSDTLVMTDFDGNYELKYQNSPFSSSWLSVELPTATSWLQVAPLSPMSYDICKFESCSSTMLFEDLDFVLNDFVRDENIGKTFGSGSNNRFGGQNETAEPSTEFLEGLERLQLAARAEHDVDLHDHYFMHSYDLPGADAPWQGCHVTGATLRLRLRAGEGPELQPYNDYIMLAQAGEPLWREHLSKLSGGRWLPSDEVELELDIDSLFERGIPGAGLQRLQGAKLDLLLGDDTSIDYTLLSIETACGTITSVNDGDSGPSGLHSISHGPNPVHTFSAVGFHLEREGRLHAELFDARGIKIRSVIAGAVLNAGYHTLKVPMEELSTGLYFLRMEFEGRVVTLRWIKTR